MHLTSRYYIVLVFSFCLLQAVGHQAQFLPSVANRLNMAQEALSDEVIAALVDSGAIDNADDFDPEIILVHPKFSSQGSFLFCLISFDDKSDFYVQPVTIPLLWNMREERWEDSFPLNLLTGELPYFQLDPPHIESDDAEELGLIVGINFEFYRQTSITGGVKVFNLPNGEELFSITDTADGYNARFISATTLIGMDSGQAGESNQFTYLIDRDKQVQLWESVTCYGGCEGPVTDLKGRWNIVTEGTSFDREGYHALDDTVLVNALSTGDFISRFRTYQEEINDLVVSGSTLFTAGGDSTVKLWRLPSGSHESTLSGHTGSVNTLSLSDDQELLASGGSDGVVNLWQMDSRQVEQSLTFDQPVKRLALSPNEQFMLVYLDLLPVLWDLENGREIPIPLPKDVRYAEHSWSPSGDYLLASSFRENNLGFVKVWNVVTGQEVLSLTSEHALSANFSPDGKWLAVGGLSEEGQPYVELYSLQSGVTF